MYGVNQTYNIHDPSALVPPHLLPHVHLVSSYRFPTQSTLQPMQALEYLIKGPQIVKDTSPVIWTYFANPPPNDTVLLTWQPPRLQTAFASDGLVWADPEVVYDMQIQGYNLQVLVHKSGFHYPHEPSTTRARFRYRITAGPGQIDLNLWIVHYTASELSHRIPSGQIPIPRDVHAQFSVRTQLQNAGPLMRKEFMLEDRTNWPEVKFGPGQTRGQPPYFNPMQPGHPYAAQPPPAKRARVLPNQQTRQSVPVVVDPSLEEEENSTQDFFDFMQPREISVSRYKQHHEWMEEIFSSPYAVAQILPIDLGLGLMGELAPLTAGILDAPVGANPRAEEYAVKSYTKLNPEQLKDFETRVAEYTVKGEAELERMKAAHAKSLADLKRSRTYRKAERRLRDVSQTDNTTDLSLSDGADDKEGVDPLNVVVQELEKSLGVKFDTKKRVVCVDKGGFIEEQQPPVQKFQQVNGNGTTQPTTMGGPNSLSNEGALHAENNAASLLDQYGSGSLTGTPGTNLSVLQISQPTSQSQSAVATPSAAVGDPTQGSSFDEQTNIASGSNDLIDLDVEMSGMANAEDKGGEGEWVMVEDQATSSGQQPSSNHQLATNTNAPVELGNQATVTTSGGEIEPTTSGIFDTADFGSFDNLDTAGDALADYTNVDDNMGLDLVDDSAFGDAFHGTEMHHDEIGDGA